MPFDFDTVIDRRGTASIKHDSVERNGYAADTLPMWIADMDFKVAPCITEALEKVNAHSIFGYSFPTDRYFEAVQNWFANRFGWNIPRDWLVFSPGVVFALSIALRVTTQPGDAPCILPLL